MNIPLLITLMRINIKDKEMKLLTNLLVSQRSKNLRDYCSDSFDLLLEPRFWSDKTNESVDC